MTTSGQAPAPHWTDDDLLAEVGRLRATVNEVQALHDRLSRERPYSLGSEYVEMLRRCLSANAGCDPWGTPCPIHGAQHWRDGIEREYTRAKAAEATVARVEALHECVTRWGNEDYSISQDAYDDTDLDDLASLTAFDVCAECFRIEQTSDQHDGNECEHAVLDGLWPCSTVRAIAAALGVTP